MGKSFPQIGNQKIVDAVRDLIFIVESGSYSLAELKAEMDRQNENADPAIFKDIDAFLNFTLADQGRSLEIIHETEDGEVSLTDEGRQLLEGKFQEEAFELFERKSTTNFTHFHSILEMIDKEYVGQQNYRLGDTLKNVVTAFQSATGNQYAARTSLGILRDFGIIEQNEDGQWVIDQEQYARLRGNPDDLVVSLLEQYGHKMSKSDLIRISIDDWGWSKERVETVLDDLKNTNRVYLDRSEGVHWVVLGS